MIKTTYKEFRISPPGLSLCDLPNAPQKMDATRARVFFKHTGTKLQRHDDLEFRFRRV